VSKSKLRTRPRKPVRRPPAETPYAGAYTLPAGEPAESSERYYGLSRGTVEHALALDIGPMASTFRIGDAVFANLPLGPESRITRSQERGMGLVGHVLEVDGDTLRVRPWAGDEAEIRRVLMGQTGERQPRAGRPLFGLTIEAEIASRFAVGDPVFSDQIPPGSMSRISSAPGPGLERIGVFVGAGVPFERGRLVRIELDVTGTRLDPEVAEQLGIDISDGAAARVEAAEEHQRRVEQLRESGKKLESYKLYNGMSLSGLGPTLQSGPTLRDDISVLLDRAEELGLRVRIAIHVEEPRVHVGVDHGSGPSETGVVTVRVRDVDFDATPAGDARHIGHEPPRPGRT
jgi:hypothetical protein